MSLIPNIMPPKSGDDLKSSWGEQVARAINSLARSNINYPLSRDDVSYIHPFRVSKSSDGAEYLYVNPGVCIGWNPSTDGSGAGTGSSTSANTNFYAPFVAEYKKFAGASIEITEATGYIYIKFDLSKEYEGYEGTGGDLEIGAQIYKPGEVGELFFSDLAPGTFDPTVDDSSMSGAKDIYVPIAEVSLTDGVASLDFQVIKENIWVELDDIEHTYSPPA